MSIKTSRISKINKMSIIIKLIRFNLAIIYRIPIFNKINNRIKIKYKLKLKARNNKI